jgi:hypothetical protein
MLAPPSTVRNGAVFDLVVEVDWLKSGRLLQVAAA